MKQAFLASAAVLALGGCASATGPMGYPAQWASIKSVPTPDGCPNLEGRYSNRSDASFPAGATPSPKLSEVFARLARVLSHWPALPDDPSSVTIVQTPKALRVTFSGAAGASASLTFRRYRFSWSDDGRLGDTFGCDLTASEPRLFLAGLNQESDHGESPVHLEASGTVFLLLKANDGSLVLQQRHQHVMAWVGLMGSGVKLDSTWHRFPAIAEATAGAGR